jgi:hypothetical protein
MTVEAIAMAYLEQAGGDGDVALRQAIADALADLCEAERRTRRVERLVSRGYARGRIGGGASPLLARVGDAALPGEP